MLRRDLVPLWAAIIVLASTYLMGQGWSPETGPPAPIPKTGQTTCYDSVGGGISCAGTGQDGELQKGVAWPNPRFTDNGDGTVTDNLTELVWTKDTRCNDTLISWSDALDYCNALADGICSLNDSSTPGEWRLANVKELWSLYDYGNYDPALPSGHPFTNVKTNEWHWSSSTYAYLTDNAWASAIYYGIVRYHEKDQNLHNAWCVRGGQ